MRRGDPRPRARLTTHESGMLSALLLLACGGSGVSAEGATSGEVHGEVQGSLLAGFRAAGDVNAKAHGAVELTGNVTASAKARVSAAAKLEVLCEAPLTDRPLGVYGWDPGSRGKVATAAVDGVVVVRFEKTGCDLVLEVLGRCVSKSSLYRFDPVRQSVHLTAQSTAGLLEEFPLAAARLRGELTMANELRVDFEKVGVERVAEGTSISEGDLVGECAGATHFVSEIHRGAFALGASIKATASLKGTLFGGEMRTSFQVLDEAGFSERCSRDNEDLIPGCDIPFMLTLTPLGSAFTGEVRALRSCSEGMVPIPAGQFHMGCHATQKLEAPVHEVELPAYCLDRTEVTKGDYRACVEKGACKRPPRCDYSSGGDFMPQPCVTPEEAETYCRSVNKRLPTEAEWEYAARGGKEGWTYPMGLSMPGDEEACVGREEACEVMSFRPEAFGLHDLAGNLSEWTSGYLADYALHARRSPRGARTGDQVVARGASYDDYPDWRVQVRSVTRRPLTPKAYPTVGFRCATNR